MGEAEKARSIHQTITMMILLVVCASGAIALYYFFMSSRSVIIPTNARGMRPMIGEDSVTSFTLDDSWATKSKLELGMVVAYRTPSMRHARAARVVAVAGDTVGIRGGRVSINGARVGGFRSKVDPNFDTEPLLVPRDTVFVLNDQQVREDDSLRLGPIPLRYIKGTLPKAPDYSGKKRKL